MAKYFDIDTPVRMNGTLTMGGNIIVPSSFSIDATGGGEIKGNVISGNTLIGNGSAITNLSSSAMTDVLKLDGTRIMTGTLSINRINTHLQLQEGGVSKWVIDSSANALRIIESGVSNRLIISGTSLTLWANVNLNGYNLSGNVINAISSLQENGVNLSSKYEAKGTLHDDRYYTEAETLNLLSGKVSYGDVMQTTNPFGGRKLYISKNDNGFFSLDKRYDVTGKIMNADGTVHSTLDSEQVSYLFNGDYENLIIVPAGKHLIVSIDFRGNYPGYPYGMVYISHYHTNISQSAKMRVYNTYEPHGVGWSEVNFSYFVNRSDSLIYEARQGKYGVAKLEFYVYAKSDVNAHITQIEINLDRPYIGQSPVVSKFANNILYGELSFSSGSGITTATITPSGYAEFKNMVVSGYVNAGRFIGDGSELTNLPIPIANSTPIQNGTNPISSGWGYTHERSTGIGSHIPTGGSTSNFLRGDGTWAVPVNTNNYVTAITGTGNSTLTLSRNGLADLTLNLAHNHNAEYNTKAEIASLLGGKSDVGHTHDFDKYQNWKVQVNGGTAVNIESLNTLNFKSSGTITLSQSGNAITINGADTNTWRPIETSPTTSTINSISSSWANTHSGKAGVSGHIPTGGTITQFLRGDGTWGTPNDSYLSSVTGGGNGTVTFNRNGMTALTLSLAHNHNAEYHTKSEITTFLSGKSDVGHTHDFDKYQYWRVQVEEDSPLNISSLSALTFKGNGTVSLGRSGNVITINGADTNTWRPIETSPSTSETSSISSSWAKNHSESTGVSSHIPTGGTASQYLKGDGTWGTPNDSYLSGVTGSGDGVVTFTRNGMASLTVNLAHNHHDEYNTKAEITALLNGKANATHTHDYDKYSNWNVQVGTGAVESVGSNNTLQFVAGSNVSIARSGKAITINSDNTWRPIETAPSTSTTNSISSSWAKTHSETTGVSGHIPTGGSTSQYLRGDGVWGTPPNNNNYVSAITSTAGGNGTLTVKQNGLADLTLSLAHNHDTSYLGINATATNSTKLENLNASQFLRSDVADSLDANLTVSPGKSLILAQTGINGTSTANRVVLSGTSGAITGGTDSADATDSNIRIHTWFGFGVASTNGSGTVPQGSNAFWVNARTGNSYAYGEFYAQQNKKVYHEGNLTPSTFVLNNTANQIVKSGFTMEGTSYAGASNLAGNFVVRTAGGSPGIQLTGDNTAQLSGVGVYLNSNGSGRFTGQLQVNTLKIDSTAVIQNLNAESVGGTKEKDIAKNKTISDIFGYGVLNGLNVQQQTVPNMTVSVSAGVAFTDSGMRVSIATPTSIALSTASASYDRIDAIYIQGAVGGNNEGVIGVVAGTPSATPVEPSLPAGAVKLGTVRILKNIGSILNAHISNVGKKMLSIHNDGDGYIWTEKLRTNSITSETTPYLQIEKPIKTSGATSITIPAGQTSATWTHNLGIGTSYAVSFSCNNVEPHVFWTNKTTNAITINLDDAVEVPVMVDVLITVY